MKKMSSMSKANRLDKLKNLAAVLAQQLDFCAEDPESGARQIAPIAKQYRDTIREIEEIEGVKSDDEVNDLLENRKALGVSKAVR